MQQDLIGRWTLVVKVMALVGGIIVILSTVGGLFGFPAWTFYVGTITAFAICIFLIIVAWLVLNKLPGKAAFWMSAMCVAAIIIHIIEWVKGMQP